MSHIIADSEKPGRVIYTIPPMGESFDGIEDGAIDTAQLAAGAVSGVKLKIGSQSWSHDIVFSSSDADTVAWASGTITMADGSTTYSISSGNTGDMTSRTYIYLDIDTSTTVLQKTTTAGTAVGDGKVMLAVAEDSTNAANFQVFGGIGGMMITGGEIENLMVEAADIAAGAIEEAKLANLAVSEAKIAADAVTATKINVVGLDGATGRIVVVDAADADEVTGGINTHATTLIQAGKILISGSTGLDDWRHGTDATKIDGGDIYTNSITATQINADTITANEIVANTITATEIANTTITDTQIASLSATKITAGMLTLSSGGVNLVCSSGALTLNPGADIKLMTTDADYAKFSFVYSSDTSQYVEFYLETLDMPPIYHSLYLMPAQVISGDPDFNIGTSTQMFRTTKAHFFSGMEFWKNTVKQMEIGSAGVTFTGATTETAQSVDNVRIGVLAGTPRIIFENVGVTQYEIDVGADSMRFIIPGLSLYQMHSGAFFPSSDEVRNLGGVSNAWNVVYYKTLAPQSPKLVSARTGLEVVRKIKGRAGQTLHGELVPEELKSKDKENPKDPAFFDLHLLIMAILGAVKENDLRLTKIEGGEAT